MTTSAIRACRGQADPDKVRPGAECPRCGEDDPDRLVWLDDERVRCATCGHVYEPPCGGAA